MIPPKHKKKSAKPADFFFISFYVLCSGGCQLVQIALHHAVVYDTEANQTEDQVKNGVVVVRNALFFATGGKLLLCQEEAQEGKEEEKNDFQNCTVCGILYGNGFACEANCPVNAVDTTSNDGQNDGGNDVASFDVHSEPPIVFLHFNILLRKMSICVNEFLLNSCDSFK